MSGGRPSRDRTVGDVLRRKDLPEGSLAAIVASTQRPTNRRRKFTPPQEAVYEELLYLADDIFGDRPARTSNGDHVRLGKSLRERMEQFMADHPVVNKSRLYEFALHRLLLELGY